MMSELGDRTSHMHRGRERAAAAPAQILTGRAERAENAAMVVDTCQEWNVLKLNSPEGFPLADEPWLSSIFDKMKRKKNMEREN